jgi:hypothetical protein
MSRYVVAGVTGRVGSIVTGARGEPVTVIARDAARTASWSARGARAASSAHATAR